MLRGREKERDYDDGNERERERSRSPHRTFDSSTAIVGEFGGGGEHVRPGDWTCPNCGANVYASKTKCYRCQTLKPGFQQGAAPVNDKIDVRPGDWTCDNCGANVFATKMACYKCQAPKPLRYMGNTMMGGFVGAGGEGAARGGDVRPGDWTCSNCGANVYATKTNCYRCQAPKPLAPEIVPAYGASFGGLGSFGGWSGGGGG